MVVAHVRLYRELLIRRLSACPQLAIAGQADDRTLALMLASSLAPHVVVVDVRMPEALEVIGDLRSKPLLKRVVAFGVGDHPARVGACRAAGAAACVPANAVSEVVSATVLNVARRPLPRARRDRSESGRAASCERRPGLWSGLTVREAEVVELIREGLSNKAIGQSLRIAKATVKNHVHNVLQKLHVATRDRVVARTVRQIP